MQDVAPRHRAVTAGAALAAVGLVVAPAVAPVVAVPPPAAAPTLARPVRLAAEGDSLLNIPFNLFQQLVNIPATEVEALNSLANSFFFTGNWFVPSATNIWGEDPGDPGHFMATINMMIPFKEISGLGSPEIDPAAAAAGTAGLGQQLALLAAAELPVSAACSADWCAPVTPTTPITGLADIDRWIWLLSVLTGVQQFPLTENWLQVPLADLTDGYTFPTVVSPSDGVGPGGAVLDDPLYGFVGTVPGPNGENLMPWSNLTFTFNPMGPVDNFYQSLLAPPDPSAFEIPTFEELGRTLQSLVAGAVIDFNPAVPGSPYCLGECELPDYLTTESIVKAIGAIWPGNPQIDHWLELTANGTANAATPEQVDFAIEFMQGLQTRFDYGNPLPSDPVNPIPFDVDPPLTALIGFMQDSGVQSVVQVVADLFGFEPATFPLDFTDIAPL